MASDSKPSPNTKPNLDIPRNAPPVERQPSGQPGSANTAGGEVRPSSYTNKQ